VISVFLKIKEFRYFVIKQVAVDATGFCLKNSGMRLISKKNSESSWDVVLFSTNKNPQCSTED
jgi:hypothetical protein